MWIDKKIIESGALFSSNHLSTPDQGARKVAHGGSGISGRGDSYGPWCTFSSISQVHKISLLTVRSKSAAVRLEFHEVSCCFRVFFLKKKTTIAGS